MAKEPIEVLNELLINLYKSKAVDLHQKVAKNMIIVLQAKGASTWNQSDTDKIYELQKIHGNPEKITPAYKKELKQINKVLYQLLKYLKKHSIIKKITLPKVQVQVRSTLAVNQDNESFHLLSEYHDILRYLQKKKPNNRKNNSTVHLDLPLILIGFDGLIKTGIDYEIARIQCKHIYIDDDSRIEIPVGRKGRNSSGYTLKTYSISSLSSAYLKILLPRNNNGYLFPRSWREKNKHKSKRRKKINHRLNEIWNIVHPNRPVPLMWDIVLWVRLSKLSMSILGVPYNVISSLSGKLNAAQLLRSEQQMPTTPRKAKAQKDLSGVQEDHHSSIDFGPMHEILANNIFLNIREIILSFNKKDKTKLSKRKAADTIEKMLRSHKDFLAKSPNTKLMVDWIIWTLRCQHYRKNTFSTFLTYFSILPCRLLPLMGEQQLSLLSQTQWIELISFLASDVDYASSSKRQTITHLKSLHTFLLETNANTPKVDWSNYDFRVQQKIASAKVVYPKEIEKLLSILSPNDPNWLVIVLAFYGGFRCEEICGLRPSDFTDGYKLNIAWSKRHTSKRSVPILWLIPEDLTNTFLHVLTQRINSDQRFLISDKKKPYIKPNTLGKRISRLLETNAISVNSMHALRHGFASWTLIRYYMLIDPSFYKSLKDGKLINNIDGSSTIFSNESLQCFSRVIGGTVWERSWLNQKACLETPTDVSIVSSLLGHTNRYTAIENYFNSFEWITRYYLKERFLIINSLNASDIIHK